MQPAHSYTDQNCVDMLNGHDKQAITILMQRLYPALCLYAEGFLKDKQIAEEIAEDAFVNLWKSKASFTNMGSIKSYLYTSTRNLCLNKLDSQKTRKHIRWNFEEDQETASDESALRKLIQAEVMAQIMNAVHALSPALQEIFKMAYLEGMSNEEIAKATGKDYQVVRNYKARALASVREKLADKDLMWLLLLIATQANRS